MKATALALLGLVLALIAVPVAADCLDPLGAMPDGPARAVDLDGRTAVVGFGRRLAVVDLSDPSAPVERGSLALPALIEAVDVEAGLALVVLRGRGVVAVDLTQPAAPVEVGRLATNEPTSVALVGSRLYVVDDDRLLVVDVADPTSPTAVGELPVWDSHLVVAEGDRLYLGQRNCPWTSCAPGFVVVDASFPDQPREIGHIPHLYPADLAVRARHAYVVAQAALVVVASTAGTAPQILAPGGRGMNARAVEVVGRLAVVSGYGRVQVVDVGDPRRPRVVASHAVPGEEWDVAVVGDTLWVADGNAGIEWLDLSGCGVSAPQLGGPRVGP